MANRPILISLFVVLAFSYANSVQTVNGRIRITLGTSAGYADISNFMRNHLLPTYELYRNFLDIEFVPWGRTVRNPNGALTCEFGVHDCWANRLHRCVLDHLRGNTQAQVEYMACEFTAPFPAFGLGSYRCVTAAGMRAVEADFCASNPGRDTLDQQAEAAATQPMAVIGSVPFVLFNGNINAQDSAEAHRRLSSMVCFALADDPNSGIRSCQI